MRGILAEFLVSSALGRSDGVRVEWDPYDVTSATGTKIEVKSASRWQTWGQKLPSTLTFGIRPTQGWNFEAGKYDGEQRRQADVYVFAVLESKDKGDLDPLNLDQWRFYVLGAQVLDSRRPTQKRITLGGLVQLGAVECNYNELAQVVERASNRQQGIESV